MKKKMFKETIFIPDGISFGVTGVMLLGFDFSVLESGTSSSNKHCSCVAVVQL